MPKVNWLVTYYTDRHYGRSDHLSVPMVCEWSIRTLAMFALNPSELPEMGENSKLQRRYTSVCSNMPGPDKVCSVGFF